MSDKIWQEFLGTQIDKFQVIVRRKHDKMIILTNVLLMPIIWNLKNRMILKLDDIVFENKVIRIKS